MAKYLHKEVLDKINVVSEYMLSRQETREANNASGGTVDCIQDEKDDATATQELPLVNPMRTMRLLTGGKHVRCDASRHERARIDTEGAKSICPIYCLSSNDDADSNCYGTLSCYCQARMTQET